jgi:hypothetical protein
LRSYLANQLSCISLCTVIHFCQFRGVDLLVTAQRICIMVQTFQTATHQLLYCNEEINLMFLFIAYSYCLFLCVSVHTFLYFLCSCVIIHCLHPLFILLFNSRCLHVSFYSSFNPSLSICSFLFLCLSVIYLPCLFFCF